MAEWHEEDHPRDDDGKFTFKNGGVSSGGILEGRVEKTDRVEDGNGSGTDDGGADNGGGIGDKIGKVGSAIGNALMAVLNSQAIPALLELLAAKYSADELNKLKEILYSQAARNEAAGNIDPRVQAGREEKQKMQNRADVLYGNDEEYNKKYHPEKLLPQDEEMTGDENIHNNSNQLQELGLKNSDTLEYKIEDKTITAVQKRTGNELIGDFRYPIHPKDEKAERLKQMAQDVKSQELRIRNSKYLKSHAKKEQFFVDNVPQPNLKRLGENFFGKESVENLHMSKTGSYLNTDYAKQHTIFNNYKELPQNLSKYYEVKITEQIGEGKLESTKGIFIDANTESSNSLKNELLNNKVFMQKLSQYENAMSKGYSINDSLNFPKGNWHYALGNADIRDMHINKDGDVELYIADVYDFNEGESSEVVRVGRDRQDKGEIIPYFIFYRVIIPKEEMQ